MPPEERRIRLNRTHSQEALTGKAQVILGGILHLSLYNGCDNLQLRSVRLVVTTNEASGPVSRPYEVAVSIEPLAVSEADLTFIPGNDNGFREWRVEQVSGVILDGKPPTCGDLDRFVNEFLRKHPIPAR
jgi:hypothetical protein